MFKYKKNINRKILFGNLFSLLFLIQNVYCFILYRSNTTTGIVRCEMDKSIENYCFSRCFLLIQASSQSITLFVYNISVFLSIILIIVSFCLSSSSSLLFSILSNSNFYSFPHVLFVRIVNIVPSDDSYTKNVSL